MEKSAGKNVKEKLSVSTKLEIASRSVSTKLEKSIKVSIFLEPNLIGPDYKNKILKKAKELFEGKCDNLHGYIGKVYDSIEILGNSISSTNPGVYFQVKIEVDSSRPILGKTYTGVIHNISPIYMFIKILGNVLVFIPKSKIKNSYEQADIKLESGLFTISIGKKNSYRVGDNMTVCIENIEYTKQKFNCIGKLILS